MFPGHRHLRVPQFHYRRAVSTSLLLTYVLTAIGVPLPSTGQAPTEKDAFPCASSRCGCDSADVCWRTCCCHTLAERLRWAREQGVRPPAFALAKARQRGFDLSWLDAGGTKRCSTDRPCCAARTSPVETSCCPPQQTATPNKLVRSCCIQAKPKALAAGESKGPRVAVWQAMKCQGQSLNWLAAVPTRVVVQIEFSHLLPFFGWLGPPASDDADASPTVPAVPPPETA
jgi:hypothetical protein